MSLRFMGLGGDQKRATGAVWLCEPAVWAGVREPGSSAQRAREEGRLPANCTLSRPPHPPETQHNHREACAVSHGKKPFQVQV